MASDIITILINYQVAVRNETKGLSYLSQKHAFTRSHLLLLSVVFVLIH